MRPQLFVTVKVDMGSVCDGNCSDSVGVGTHRRPHGTAALAVSAGGGGMACTTVGVGDSSMAHMTVGAGDDGMMGIDIHTAVGAGSEDACDGVMVGIDCHMAVGTGSVWPADTADSEPKSASAMVTGSAVGGEESQQENTKRLKHSFGGDGCSAGTHGSRRRR